jgi:hypothetical protein
MKRSALRPNSVEASHTVTRNSLLQDLGKNAIHPITPDNIFPSIYVGKMEYLSKEGASVLCQFR